MNLQSDSRNQDLCFQQNHQIIETTKHECEFEFIIETTEHECEFEFKDKKQLATTNTLSADNLL